MLRAIVLSLALLIGIGTLIPLATEYAEAGSKKPRKYKKKRAKKYSKRWWRAYNKRKKVKQAKQRRAKKVRAARLKKARIKRARTARLKRTAVKKRRATTARKRSKKRGVSTTARRSNVKTAPKPQKVVKSPGLVEVSMTAPAIQPAELPAAPPKVVKAPRDVEVGMTAPAAKTYTAPAVLPSGNPAPESWKSGGLVQGELQFSVTDTNGSMLGAASISVVGPAVDEPAYSSRIQTVGGVATNALRRTVIDQMIRENGWVVNDFQKEVGGKKVYVVVAQTPGQNNQVESRTYYFTEVEGKIYSVATKAPEYNMERIEEESEKVLNSLQRRTAPTQLAVNRTVSNLVANEE